MYILGETLDDVLNQSLKSILENGTEHETSRGEIIELIGISLRIKNPLARLSLSLERSTLFSCIGEFLWYMRGTSALAPIKYYIPKYKDESADGFTIRGAYGPRFFDDRGTNQIGQVVKTLQNKPTSRKAIIAILNSGDIARYRKEIPCTVSIQFLARDGKLNCIVNMRSNDAYLGLPHDVFAFTMLQECIARELKLELGVYHHNVGSFHVYKRNLSNIESYLGEGFQPTTLAMPQMPVTPINIWKSKVLTIEEKYRKGKLVKISELEKLDEYWVDICCLMKIFAGTKGSASETQVSAAQDTVESLNSIIFKEIAQTRIDQKLGESTQHIMDV